MDSRLEIVHVGNDSKGQGGIASVIRRHLRRGLGPGFIVQSLASYDPDAVSLLGKHLPFLGALKTILTARPRSGRVWHFHLAQRGSLLREGTLIYAARLRGHRTLVATIHGSSTLDAGTRAWLFRAATRPVRVLHVLSQAHAEWVDVGGQRCVVIPNDVEVPATVKPISARSKAVLFAGEVGTRKGVDLLVEAWSRVAPPGWRLNIAGPLAEGAQVPTGPCVEYLGTLPHQEILRRLEDSRVAVLPSRAEALPMFVCEAMASGCPVVATDVGATAELLGSSSLLVRSEDVALLMQALRRVTGDPAVAESESLRNRQFAKDRLSPDVVSPQWSDLYSALVSAGT